MIIEIAEVVENREIARNIWQLEMNAPGITKQYIGPGQFINILAEDDWGHPLRRPMSIASVTGATIAIIYKIFGPVTELLTQKESGFLLNLLGPLGNIFSNWNGQGFYPILIGGGVGLAPILNLHHACKNREVEHALIIGARNKSEHFITHDSDRGIYLTTDDGSQGISGTVMPTLEKVLASSKNPALYACGPESMLKAVQALALENQIPAQLSVESYMGCGVGLCQGCAISREGMGTKEHSYHEKYSLVCLDGPVYSASEVVFD